MPAAAAAAQLGADDRDDLDAGLAQQRVGDGVAVVGEDDARLDRDGVVAAVPLLALGGVDVAAGLDDPQLGEPERARRRRRRTSPSPRSPRPRALVAGPQGEGVDRRPRCRGKSVTMSRSAKVKTVSRCMAARSFGMPATTTRSAAPCSNSAAATWVIACRDVRSLMPISTTPLPTGMMSPPSKVGLPPVLLRVAPPDGRADEVGVELVDRLHQQGLVVPRRPVERVQGHAAVQPARGVAGVERVRQRRHQVLADAGRTRGPARRSRTGSRRAGRRSPGRRSGTRPARVGRATRGTRGCRRPGRGRPRSATILRSSSQALASGIAMVCGEQVVQLDDLDAAVAQLVDEVGVVALGVLDPHARRRRAGRRRWSGSAGGAPGPGAQTSTLRSSADLGVHAVGARRGGVLVGHRNLPEPGGSARTPRT